MVFVFGAIVLLMASAGSWPSLEELPGLAVTMFPDGATRR